MTLKGKSQVIFKKNLISYIMSCAASSYFLLAEWLHFCYFLTFIIKPHKLTMKFHFKSFKTYLFELQRIITIASLKTYLCIYFITPLLDFNFAIWIEGVHVFKMLYLRILNGDPLIFADTITSRFSSRDLPYQVVQMCL